MSSSGYLSEGWPLRETTKLDPSVTVELLAKGLRREKTGWHGQMGAKINDTAIMVDTLNLERARARSDFVGAVMKRLQDVEQGLYLEAVGHGNLAVVVDRFALRCIESLDAGEPFKRLGEGDKPAPRPWLIDGFLRSGEHTVLFGFKGTAKSLLALAFAYDIQSGSPRLGRQVIEGPVQVLDWECDSETADERAWLIAAGRGESKPPPIFYRRMVAPLAEDIESVRRFGEREGVVLTIIDSQGLAVGGPPTQAGPVLAFYAAAREIGGAILGIDHRPYDDGARQKPSPYGSVYKANAARSLWLAKAAQEQGDSEIHVGVFHQTANNYGLQRPMGFLVSFAEGAITIKPEDARELPMLREGLSATERCWLALERPLTTAQLAEETGLKPDTVRQACNRHQKIVRSGQDGREATWARLSDQP